MFIHKKYGGSRPHPVNHEGRTTDMIAHDLMLPEMATPDFWGIDGARILSNCPPCLLAIFPFAHISL